MKRENNDWKGKLHAAVNARSMDPEFGSIPASGRGGGRKQRIQFYIGIFRHLPSPFSGAPSEGSFWVVLHSWLMEFHMNLEPLSVVYVLFAIIIAVN